MSKSYSNSKKIKGIKMPEKVITELFENMPKDLAETTLSIGRKEGIDKSKYIEKMVKLSEENRWFGISVLMYFTNENIIAEEILLELFDYSHDGIKERILISLTHRKNEKLKEKASVLRNNKNEILKSAYLWSLAFMGENSNLFNSIKQILPILKRDKSRLYLIAALYHLNNNPKSKEMQFLKKLFLTEYFDEEDDELLIYNNPFYGLSSSFLCNLLWNVGIKIIRPGDGRILKIFGYMLEEMK